AVVSRPGSRGQAGRGAWYLGTKFRRRFMAEVCMKSFGRARSGPGMVAAGAVAAVVVLLPSATSAADVDFNRDVLPILSARCFTCHGPDAGKRKAGLHLDVRESVVADRDGPRAVVPGRPEQSELIARLTADDEEGRMPPPKDGARLEPGQVRVLRAWV